MRNITQVGFSVAVNKGIKNDVLGANSLGSVAILVYPALGMDNGTILIHTHPAFLYAVNAVTSAINDCSIGIENDFAVSKLPVYRENKLQETT